MGRSPCCDKAKVKKGPWSAEEDALLVNFVAKFGHGGNWISLPKRVGLNRCGKSCRLRWLNYLRPNIKHGNFTEEEDHIIYSLYNTIGSRWSMIASKLPGRTDNDVKNYWNTKLKRKISSGKFQESFNIVPITSINTKCNSGISAHMNTYNSPQYCQTLGNNDNEKIMPSSKLDKSNYNDTYNMGQADVKHTKNFISSIFSSVTPDDLSSYSCSSSSIDVNQSSSHGSITSSSSEEEGFWMDLMFDSFEDVVVGSQLEEKISEIASLLDDSICC